VQIRIEHTLKSKFLHPHKKRISGRILYWHLEPVLPPELFANPIFGAGFFVPVSVAPLKKGNQASRIGVSAGKPAQIENGRGFGPSIGDVKH
jgi:hypothetical protein